MGLSYSADASDVTTADAIVAEASVAPDGSDASAAIERSVFCCRYGCHSIEAYPTEDASVNLNRNVKTER